MTYVCAFFCCQASVGYYDLGTILHETKLGKHYFVKYVSTKIYEQNVANIILCEDHCGVILVENENKAETTLPDLQWWAKDICIESCCEMKGIGAITDCKALQAPLLKMAQTRSTYTIGINTLYVMLREHKMVPDMILPTNQEIGLSPEPATRQRIIWCCETHFIASGVRCLKTYKIGNQLLSISVSKYSVDPLRRIVIPYKFLLPVLSYYATSNVSCEAFDLSHSAANAHRAVSPDLPAELSGCRVCKTEIVKSCVCKTVWYCGTDCQRKDRAMHRPHCSAGVLQISASH